MFMADQQNKEYNIEIYRMIYSLLKITLTNLNPSSKKFFETTN
jgi:hypothetical protein